MFHEVPFHKLQKFCRHFVPVSSHPRLPVEVQGDQTTTTVCHPVNPQVHSLASNPTTLKVP